jgi:putative heme iron utilization protein
MNTPLTAFDPQLAAKRLLRQARSAALGTLDAAGGAPYCSLVNVATAADGAPLLLLSGLALHTRNIVADPRVSLLLSDGATDRDPLQGARVSLAGGLAVTQDSADRRRYLARHPEAESFAGFPDFAFYRMAVEGGHLVAGFGRIVDLTAEALRTPVDDAAALLAAEEGACAHMNADHADALQLYATKLLGAADGAWRCVGCDPEGLDLQRGCIGLRLPFPARVRSPAELRQVLVQFAQTARAA